MSNEPALERFGKYQLVSRLFADEASEGYQALLREQDGERTVCLKIFREELSASELFAELFDEAVELGQQMDHPNVVHVIDSGRLGANLYIGLYFHEGRTLRQLLHALHQQHVILPPEYAAYLAVQACEALEYLHNFKDNEGRSVRVVHHDICPGSLHLDFHGDLRMFEPGMVRARNIGEPELATASIGRPAYFGPERIKGSRPTPRSDVYGLGVVLWELLTGRRLFAGTDREEIMAEVLIAEVQPPSEFNPEVSEELDQIVMKAIDRRVLRRYATATVFKNALRQYLADTNNRTLRAGVAGVMDTLFGEERDEREITGTLKPMHESVTGRLGDFAEKNDTRPGPGERGAAKPAEPWVKGKDRQATPDRKPLMLGLGLLAALAVGGGLWATSDSSDDAPEPIEQGQRVVDELQRSHPDASDPDGLKAAEGWIALSEGTPEALVRARSDLEVAVAADPYNASAIAGLALVYAHEQELALKLAAPDLLGRAEALAVGDESLRRAQAGVALASNNHERAVSKGRECLIKQDDPLCRWYLGEGLLALGDYEGAKQELALAVEALPLAPGLQRSYGEAAMEARDYRGAADALEAAVRRLPEQAEVHLTLAELHRRTGDFDQAVQAADRVLALDPRHVEARYLKGTVLLHVNKDAKQAASVLGGLAEDPGIEGKPIQSEALVQAAFASLAAERHADAQRYAQQALDKDPEHANARLALALALEAQGDDEGSEDALSAKGSSLKGRSAARYHYHAASVYQAHDHQRFARLSLESALASDPAWVPPHVALSLVEVAMGDAGLDRLLKTWNMDHDLDQGRDPIVPGPIALQSPVQVWEALSSRKPNRLADPDEATRIEGVLLAMDCMQGGDCARAVGLLTRAVEAFPEDPASRVFLARALMAQGDHAAAEEHLRVASTHQDHAMIEVLLGDCHQAQGRYDRAVAAYTMAAEKGRPSSSLYRKLAISNAEAGETERAEQYARQALSMDPDDLAAAKVLLGR
jgi:tetratricopeptide (TPR) repeat protein